MLEPLTAISLASAIIQFVDFGSKICDVRTCLLTKNGHWPGMTRSECEQEVDGWLADAPARSAPVVLAKPSRSSKRLSLRVRIKRLLA